MVTDNCFRLDSFQDSQFKYENNSQEDDPNKLTADSAEQPYEAYQDLSNENDQKD